MLSDNDLVLRLVELDDAEFILSLRLDQKRAQFLNETDSSVEKQKEWIREYKKREAKAQEFYFLIEKDYMSYGTIRIYKITDKTCYWGSWITKPTSPRGFGKRALTLVLKFIFDELKKEKVFFSVELDNKAGKKLYLELGSKLINEDEKEITYSLTKDEFYNTAIARLSK